MYPKHSLRHHNRGNPSQSFQQKHNSTNRTSKNNEDNFNSSQMNYREEESANNYYQPSYASKNEDYRQNVEYEGISPQEEQSNDIIQEIYLPGLQNMVQYIIGQNNQIMTKLSTQNAFLVKHMENVEKMMRIFSTKLKNNSIRNRVKYQDNSDEVKTSVSTKKQTIRKIHQKIEQKMSESNVNSYQRRQRQKRASRNSISKQMAIQLQEPQVSKVKKGVCLIPMKGATNYQKEEWIVEQNYILKFLHQYLKHVVKVSPDNIQHTIAKEKMKKLYLKWRNLHNLQPQLLPAFKVQQIITNQIKAMFGCTCTPKQYVGVYFDQENMNFDTEELQLQRKQQEFSEGEFNADDTSKYLVEDS